MIQELNIHAFQLPDLYIYTHQIYQEQQNMFLQEHVLLFLIYLPLTELKMPFFILESTQTKCDIIHNLIHWLVYT